MKLFTLVCITGKVVINLQIYFKLFRIVFLKISREVKWCSRRLIQRYRPFLTAVHSSLDLPSLLRRVAALLRLPTLFRSRNSMVLIAEIAIAIQGTLAHAKLEIETGLNLDISQD